jgi:hypothetical protein
VTLHWFSFVAEPVLAFISLLREERPDMQLASLAGALGSPAHHEPAV